ncbi:FMN-binding protein [Blastococcus sp. URHD0036]|uniref:FMN-binding protein n=1 Tax=Blastococcus sp. URHD0036 TaxID=1380356 RepID=UPI000496DBDB|nr:FMN-binding protein [Blastococcus sp. URHD0036]
MRRIVLWVMSTLTVLVLVFGYSTSTSSRMSATSDSSVVEPVTGTASSGSGSSGSSSSGSSGSATSGGGADPVTVTGDAASTRWGPVQVQLTVQDGTITDVSVVRYPDGNGRDQQINARALPILVRETLAAQGAGIDMVSGATVTSNGYLDSLQSALDQAGL